ncbi:MAG: zinc ribbon domain-containing protein [Spirochaetales bacterium]|nr:zinc ribbon domain-containing protein [Spirochaetales bacterium]
MKRIMILLAVLTVIFATTGCASMRTQDNIVVQSEFIYCNDPDCQICGGTGELVCTACNGDKTGPCEHCGATGVIDCEPILLFDCVDGNAFVPSEDQFVPCTDCDGTGKYAYDETMECPECSGDGILDCPKCHGEGVLDCSKCVDGIADCSTCKGAGYLVHGETLYYTICLNCETRLDDGATVCTNCGMGVETYVCKDCGEVFKDEFETCPACGN